MNAEYIGILVWGGGHAHHHHHHDVEDVGEGGQGELGGDGYFEEYPYDDYSYEGGKGSFEDWGEGEGADDDEF